MTSLAETWAPLLASRHTPLPHALRKNRLRAMLAWILKNENRIAQVVSEDFSNQAPGGGRSLLETRMADVMTVANSIRHTLAHMDAWMRDEPRPMFWGFLPAQARVLRQPKGVVGIISPWNYPFQLAIGPLSMAIAAGNRVLLKPSELTPKTSDLMVELIKAVFSPEEVGVVMGGAETGDAVARLPLDHIFFTGSTAVGRKVALAAAENLTPITLELGGKSPVLVHASAIPRAAKRVAFGKLLNAGQTCIAPDYVLLVGAEPKVFAAALQDQIKKSYPTIANNKDYTSIINERHFHRLTGLVEDARARGCEVISVGEGSAEQRRLAPTLILGATRDCAVMQEEIFGPVLPILSVPSVEAGMEFVRSMPRPLALYVFDEDTSRANKIVSETVSGGAMINDTILHVAVDDLPFGGVGPSGVGASHGFDGFRSFCHEKAVMEQAKINAMGVLTPPWGALADQVLKVLTR